MSDYENAAQEELIRRAKRGDVKAFSRLYAQIYKELYRFALYMTKHPQDAEDAVSEAVISAFENMFFEEGGVLPKLDVYDPS